MMRRYFPDLAERMPRQRVTSLGSGVIVAAEGFVLTNHHVIDGADDIQLVLHDGRRIGAHVRGTDPESDLAVLKADEGNLPAITFGAIERVQVGDPVLAIGNPFGFGNTVTVRNRERARAQSPRHQPLRGLHPDRRGDQSRQLRRRARRRGRQPDRHQQHRSCRSQGPRAASASRFPCRSRGTCWSRSSGTAKSRAGGLASSRRIAPDEAAKGGPQEGGVAIRGIVKDGPADRAGIRVRDVVVDIGGKPTRDTPALLARIAELPPGSTVKVKIWRDRSLQDVDVTVGKRPHLPS